MFGSSISKLAADNEKLLTPIKNSLKYLFSSAFSTFARSLKFYFWIPFNKVEYLLMGFSFQSVNLSSSETFGVQLCNRRMAFQFYFQKYDVE